MTEQRILTPDEAIGYVRLGMKTAGKEHVIRTLAKNMTPEELAVMLVCVVMRLDGDAAPESKE